MKHNKYRVTLTNGSTYQSYDIIALNEREAIILAQAEAIKLARGYEFEHIMEWQ